MATRTQTSARGYHASATVGSVQEAQQPRRRTFLQGLREDMHLAQSMANARRLRGENVSNLTGDELMARVRAAYAPR